MYKLDCKDAYTVLGNLVPVAVKAAGKQGGAAIQSIWDGIPSANACTDKTGKTKLGEMCQLLTLAKDPLKKAGVDPAIVTAGCEALLNGCQPTFCSKGEKASQLGISCTEFKSLAHTVLSMDSVKKQLPVTEDNYCDVLATLAQGDVHNLTKLLATEVEKKVPSGIAPKETVTKYADRLGPTLKCMCPGIEDKKPPPKPPATPKPPGYNSLVIVATILVLTVLLIVPFGFRAIISPTSGRFLVLFVVILLVVAIVTLLLWANPRCLYKPCISRSDDWVPTEGTFRGHTEMYGVTITAGIEADKNNNVTLRTLTCDGRGCPNADKSHHADLIRDCTNKTIQIGGTKTVYGYPLMGSCVDELSKITTTDGSPAVRGLWVVRNGSDIEVQIYLHIGISGDYVINEVVRIPIQKVSDGS